MRFLPLSVWMRRGELLRGSLPRSNTRTTVTFVSASHRFDNENKTHGCRTRRSPSILALPSSPIPASKQGTRSAFPSSRASELRERGSKLWTDWRRGRSVQEEGGMSKFGGRSCESDHSSRRQAGAASGGRIDCVRSSVARSLERGATHIELTIASCVTTTAGFSIRKSPTTSCFPLVPHTKTFPLSLPASECGWSHATV